MMLVEGPFLNRTAGPLLMAGQLYSVGLLAYASYRLWRSRREGARYFFGGVAFWLLIVTYEIIRGVANMPIVMSMLEYGFAGIACSLLVRDVRRYMGMLDASERKTEQVRAALHETELEHAEIFASLGEGVVVVDADRTVRVFNTALARVTRTDDPLGEQLLDVLPLTGDGRGALNAALERCQRDRAITSTELTMNGDKTRHFVCTLSPSQRVGTILIFNDITDRAELTERMIDVDRAIAVGRLAAGVGHEINNPLSYIVLNMHEARNALDSGDIDVPLLRELVDDSAAGASRIRDIVRALRVFGGTEPATKRARPREIVTAAIDLVKSEVRHQASLVVEHRPAPTVLVDEAKLTQVLVNLLRNAAQATPPAGDNRIEVITSTAGSDVVIEVRDTGSGIDKEDLRRIFDPFFTTRPMGEGSGLGLSIARAHVAAMNGKLEVESVVGEGSTFRVTLPIAARSEAPEAVPKSDRTARKRSLLIVDDEAQLVRALSRALSADMRITTAADGDEALALIRSGHHYDALIVDLMMPNMSGIELHERLTEERPTSPRRCCS